MGLRLLFLSWWTPNHVIRRELADVSDRTTSALQSLLATHAYQEPTAPQPKKLLTIGAHRANMAKTHTHLVEALEATVGQDKAVQLGREALFRVGQELGRQTRGKLGVGDNPKDLARAAKILYRVLGIEFHLEWLDDSNAVAWIDRCALAQQYSKLTCRVLSATDEGVISGLQPNVTMQFKAYLTEGCKNCRADLHFNPKETP